MKPVWLVESHVGDEPGFQAMIQHLQHAAYAHHVMRFVPFSYDLVGGEPAVSSPCIAFGGAGVADYVTRKGLEPGVWTGPQFAPSHYARRLGALYLNHLQIECTLSEVPSIALRNDWSHFFMRPNNDLKPFAGRVFAASEVAGWVADLGRNNLLADNNYRVTVAPLLDIGREWRTVVVNGVPIAWSQYKQDGHRKDEPSIEPAALQAVKDAVKLFAPADIFVADVCETPEAMKIVEYNTFNSAGLYACDIAKVIDVVSMFVTEQWK